MNLLYLSTWSSILHAMAAEAIAPIISFTDPVQAIQHMHRENAAGSDIEAITNDGEVYWLVSASVADRLCKANFYPIRGVRPD